MRIALYLTQKPSRGRTRGFALIELLAAFIIFSVLMAIAVPLYFSSMASAEREQCREQMQAIVNAEEEYKRKAANHAYTTTLANLNIGGAPIPPCPSGGSHTIDSTSPLRIKCSYHFGSADQHGTFTPNVDNY